MPMGGLETPHRLAAYYIAALLYFTIPNRVTRGVIPDTEGGSRPLPIEHSLATEFT
jgi:hypothetical protein